MGVNKFCSGKFFWCCDTKYRVHNTTHTQFEANSSHFFFRCSREAKLPSGHNQFVYFRCAIIIKCYFVGQHFRFCVHNERGSALNVCMCLILPSLCAVDWAVNVQFFVVFVRFLDWTGSLVRSFGRSIWVRNILLSELTFNLRKMRFPIGIYCS